MKRFIKAKILLAISAILPLLISPVSAGTLSWIIFWGSPDFEVASDIAMDSSGNIYITGVRQSAGCDAFVVSFDSSGCLRWEALWGAPMAYENAYGIALDAFGNVYITGVISPGPFGVLDVFVASFNLSGNFQWATLWGTPNYEWASAVCVDFSGNIYVAGRTSQVDYPGPWDAFVVSFDSSGGFRWEAFWGSPNGYDRADAVAVDLLGNVYIGGRTGQGEIYGQPFDAILVSYDNSGNLRWEAYWSKTACDYIYDITLDPSGNIYIAGGLDVFGPFGGTDAFVASFNSSGVLKWEAFWGTPNREIAYGVTLGPLGNVYIAGYTTQGPYGGDDAFLVSFDPLGSFNWKAILGKGGLDQAMGVTSDFVSKVYIAGCTYPGPLGHYDVFVAAYIVHSITARVDITPDTMNLAGNRKWINCYIEVPHGYDVKDIDISTISINDTITVDLNAPTRIGDHDKNGISDLMVKFDRASLEAWLQMTGSGSNSERSYCTTFKITGKINGIFFEGFDTVTIYDKG